MNDLEVGEFSEVLELRLRVLEAQEGVLDVRGRQQRVCTVNEPLRSRQLLLHHLSRGRGREEVFHCCYQ